MNLERRSAIRLAGGLAAYCSSWGALQTVHGATDQTSPTPEPIRVGQIGVAHGHANKLAEYRASTDYDVVGVVEPDPDLRTWAQSQPAFSGVKWLSEQQLLETPGLQVVLVETQVRDLLATANRCIAAGKHIHLDKPAGASLSAFTTLLQQAEQQQLLVQMGYMYRYNPAVLLLHELLEQNALGEIFEIQAVMSKVVDQESRAKLAGISGGMMFELGCHLIDLVVGLLGEPLRSTPYAQHASTQSDDTLNDNMLAVLEYPRAIATVKTSAMEVEGFARRHLTVCGSGGTFHIQPLDAPTGRLALSEPHASYQRGYQDVAFPKFTRYQADARDMAQILRGEKQSDFNYFHDLAVQKTVLQAAGMPLA